jgi:hypothetical protein
MKKRVIIGFGFTLCVLSAYGQGLFNNQTDTTINNPNYNRSVNMKLYKDTVQNNYLSTDSKNSKYNQLSETDIYLRQLRKKIDEIKLKDGKEYFENGKLKLAINITFLEDYHTIYQTIDTNSWIDQLKNRNSNPFHDLYQSYLYIDSTDNSLLELYRNVKSRYTKQHELDEIKNSDFNKITTVEFEEP